MDEKKFVSRGGIKLEHALKTFNIDVSGLTVLDVGSSTGGFVDCLLQNGATKVYALDTAYGELAWKLRQDPRVVPLERTNILFFDNLTEAMDLITIDVTFTSLLKILPKIKVFLKENGRVVALLKPQYEDQRRALKNKGVIPDEDHSVILAQVVKFAGENGYQLLDQEKSPITGTGGNTEYLLYLSFSGV